VRHAHQRLAESISRETVVRKRTLGLSGEVVTLVGRSHTPVLEWRWETLETKEPETLRWMRTFPAGHLVDVGANIGLYSLYYGLACNGTSTACEPSPYNLETLAENIRLNQCTQIVDVIPCAISNGNGLDTLHLSSLDIGGACSSLGSPVGPDGKQFQPISGFRTLGLTLDELLNRGWLRSSPSLLKIDVDGNEALVLRGATEFLRRKSLVSVLVEVDDRYSSQATEVSDILTRAGFHLESKEHSPMIDGGKWKTIWNQIWVRT